MNNFNTLVIKRVAEMRVNFTISVCLEFLVLFYFSFSPTLHKVCETFQSRAETFLTALLVKRKVNDRKVVHLFKFISYNGSGCDFRHAKERIFVHEAIKTRLRFIDILP